MQRGDCHRLRELFSFAEQQTRREVVHTRRFPALNPRIRINTRGFADADIIIERRTGEIITQWGEKRCGAIVPPLGQISARAVKVPAL
ncbi:hypothetical protein D3C80_870660 [compost metagenome]